MSRTSFELFHHLQLRLKISLSRKGNSRLNIPPLRYPQPVGAAWDPKSLSDSFDFFPIERLERFVSLGPAFRFVNIFLRKFIFRQLAIFVYIQNPIVVLFQIMDLWSLNILVSKV